MARRKPRGLPTDSNFSDEVFENNGTPILSGGGSNDNAIINQGEAQVPVLNPGPIIIQDPVFRTKSIPIFKKDIIKNDFPILIPRPKPPTPLSPSRHITVSIFSKTGGSILINGVD